jgi:hypothetical protein
MGVFAGKSREEIANALQASGFWDSLAPKESQGGTLSASPASYIPPSQQHTVPQTNTDRFMQDVYKANNAVAAYKQNPNKWENEDTAIFQTGIIGGARSGEMDEEQAAHFIKSSMGQYGIDLNSPEFREMLAGNNNDNYVNLGVGNRWYDATFPNGSWGTEVGEWTLDPELGNQSSVKDSLAPGLGMVLNVIGAATGQPYLAAAGSALSGWSGEGDWQSALTSGVSSLGTSFMGSALAEGLGASAAGSTSDTFGFGGGLADSITGAIDAVGTPISDSLFGTGQITLYNDAGEVIGFDTTANAGGSPWLLGGNTVDDIAEYSHHTGLLSGLDILDPTVESLFNAAKQIGSGAATVAGGNPSISYDPVTGISNNSGGLFDPTRILADTVSGEAENIARDDASPYYALDPADIIAAGLPDIGPQQDEGDGEGSGGGVGGGTGEADGDSDGDAVAGVDVVGNVEEEVEEDEETALDPFIPYYPGPGSPDIPHGTGGGTIIIDGEEVPYEGEDDSDPFIPEVTEETSGGGGGLGGLSASSLETEDELASLLDLFGMPWLTQYYKEAYGL